LNVRAPRFAARLSACAAVSAIVVWTMIAGAAAFATPANRIALVRYYGRFLPRRLDACTTCHLPSTTPGRPASLKEFPHNSFGRRLAEVGQELAHVACLSVRPLDGLTRRERFHELVERLSHLDQGASSLNGQHKQ
jgi:hypothetical protein